MSLISAHTLLNAKILSSDDAKDTRAVLPFFTTFLDVRFLLVELPGGEVFVVRDLPNKVTGRKLRDTLEKTLTPGIPGQLAQAPPDKAMVVRDIQNQKSGLTLRYNFMPALQNHLADVRPDEFLNLLHYDPWWLLKDRGDIPQEVRDAVVATNIADLKIYGRPLSKVYFEDTLLRVAGVRVPRMLLGSRFIPRDDLFPVFH